jgi:hypothetical protein
MNPGEVSRTNDNMLVNQGNGSQANPDKIKDIQLSLYTGKKKKQKRCEMKKTG